MITCKRKMCSSELGVTMPIEHGRMSGLGCANETQAGLAGERCLFTCDPGYALTGPASLLCDGTQEGPPRYNPSLTPSCVPIFCPAIDCMDSKDPVFKCISNSFNSECIVMCREPGIVPSTKTVKCAKTGKWDPPLEKVKCDPPVLPTCEPGLAPVDNGKWTGECNPGKLGKTCILICDFGFEARGGIERKCINGSEGQKWDIEQPAWCLPIMCPGLTAPQNGFLQGQCAPGLPGQTCILTCNSGYSPQFGANPSLMCDADGQWSGRVPNCVRGGPEAGGGPICRPKKFCCLYPVLKNPLLMIQCRVTGSQYLPEAGSTCQVGCQKGNLVEMREVKTTRRTSFFSSSYTQTDDNYPIVKQELFFHKKAMVITCLITGKWSGINLNAINCLPSPSSSSGLPAQNQAVQSSPPPSTVIPSQSQKPHPIIVRPQQSNQSSRRRQRQQNSSPRPFSSVNGRQWINIKTSETRIVSYK